MTSNFVPVTIVIFAFFKILLFATSFINKYLTNEKGGVQRPERLNEK